MEDDYLDTLKEVKRISEENHNSHILMLHRRIADVQKKIDELDKVEAEKIQKSNDANVSEKAQMPETNLYSSSSSSNQTQKSNIRFRTRKKL